MTTLQQLEDIVRSLDAHVLRVAAVADAAAVRVHAQLG